MTIILENQWIWYNTLSGCSWYSFEDVANNICQTSDVNLLQYKSSSRKSRLLTLWLNIMCKLYYCYNHCLLVWLHWTLPQSKEIAWIYVTYALFGNYLWNHLWIVIPNKQLYSINTSFDEQMAKWMMSVSSRVRALVRERENDEKEWRGRKRRKCMRGNQSEME